MNIEKSTAEFLKMSDEEWMRHANPVSGWTRFATLPLIFLAVWSRKWLKWFALIPVGLVGIWTWYNARMFKKPESTDNWMSKVVLGERAMAGREQNPVPEHHLPVLKVTRAIISCGGLLSIYGLSKQKGWPALLGMVLIILGKTWYMDRMVWLFEEMKDSVPEYRAWLY
ncbi:MAG: hypothetical protein KKF41_04545 [Actinobacteria bacterium]|nr:hypothetical protein [Actinomycetota bacterium]MBU1943480.1 hypothetical protein [Actinomycetota bacterium]MBU2686837.1 hypothetical protein [Actinomycetota bacterium]